MMTVHTVTAVKLLIHSMPTSCAALAQCMCEECIGNGSHDEKGPKGVLMAEHLISAHVWHVKAESAECAASTIAGKSTVSSITNNLDHLTLSMDSPQPPLFTSSVNNNVVHPGPCNPPAVSVSALSHNLKWLELSHGMSAPLMTTTSQQAASNTVSKPKHNQCTVKTLYILMLLREPGSSCLLTSSKIFVPSMLLRMTWNPACTLFYGQH
jgi:hypothetical protein